MSSPSTAPKLDLEEAAILEQLDRVEAAARSKPTARVVKRALDLAVHLRGLASFAHIRDKVAGSNEPEPTLDEINAEIAAARAERRTRPQGDR